MKTRRKLIRAALFKPQAFSGDFPRRFGAEACLAAALLLAPAVAQAGFTGIFGGGPFYKNAANNITEIKNSGFSEAIVWSVEVHTNGDLNLNGEFPLCSGGSYVGNSTHSDFPGNMAELKQGTVKRVTLSVGSSNVGDWQDIEALVNSQGTGPGSVLYQNFQALKSAVPAIDAIDFDDENNFDENSTAQFAVMLGNLGYKVMLDAYDNSSYWTGLASAINTQSPGTCDGVHLQCYSGGAYNSPCTFGNFGSVPVYPGLWDQNDTPSQVQSTMSGWNSSCSITGGFMWIYDDFVGNGEAAQYASAINNAVGSSGGGGIYNQTDGIVTDGSSFSGGLDGVGYAYSANLLGSTLTWSGGTFTFGPANGADVINCTGQQVSISGQGASLLMLATAVNGSQTSQSFTVHYSDGSSSGFSQSLSDWYTPQNYSGESVVKAMAYRDASNGTEDHRTFNLYGYSFAINSAKTVSSVTVPNNSKIKVLAFAITGGSGGNPVTVSLSSVFNRTYGLVEDGSSFSASAGLDDDGNGYSANLLGSSLSWDSLNFNFGPANGSDATSCNGQTVSLPSGKFSTLAMLATGVNGNQTAQQFTVKYSDGSSSSYSVNLSDWFTPQGYSGESEAKAMAYRDSSNGGEDNRTFYLYGYALTITDAKTISSLVLPNNANVEVLAITLSP